METDTSSVENGRGKGKERERERITGKTVLSEACKWHLAVAAANSQRVVVLGAIMSADYLFS